MNTFFELNGAKLKFIFLRMITLCLGLVTIALVLSYLSGAFPNNKFLVGIVLIAGIGIPIFVLSLEYIVWQINHQARVMAFSTAPFSEIIKIGFANSYKGEYSKWSFAYDIKEGCINGYSVLMDISNEKHQAIEFQIPTKWKKFNQEEFDLLVGKFKSHNIEFRIGSLIKYTRSNRNRNLHWLY